MGTTLRVVWRRRAGIDVCIKGQVPVISGAKAIGLSKNQSEALFLDRKRREAKKEAEQMLGLSPTGR